MRKGWRKWKDVPGYDGDYQVSRTGLVKSFKHKIPAILKSKISQYGYREVSLCKNGKISYKRINRLVAQAFVPNPLNLPEVNHLDGDKLNNNDWNLEWSTGLENKAHAVKNKLNAYGEKCNLSKLTEKQVAQLRSLEGKYKTKELAKMFNITRLTVYRILKGKLWKQSKK